MDETDTESERWRLSRYAPPSEEDSAAQAAAYVRRINELCKQLDAERSKVHSLTDALLDISSYGVATANSHLTRLADNALAQVKE